MSRRVYLYFAATFCLGVLLGGLGMAIYGWYVGGYRRQPPNPERVARYLSRRLKLNPTQYQEVKGILEDSWQKFAALHQQMAPQFQAIHAETQSRIRQVLNPAQLAEFNRMVQEWQKRRQQMRRRPPPPR